MNLYVKFENKNKVFKTNCEITTQTHPNSNKKGNEYFILVVVIHKVNMNLMSLNRYLHNKIGPERICPEK